jgi:predicted  nucleic acid-binding Zn-ribbon protein
MNSSIYEQRELMIKLQTYDKKIIGLDQILGKVDDQVEKLDEKVKQESEKIDRLQKELKEKKKLYQMYEGDFETNGQRIEKYEEHLKKLASPKDYRALQREVDETRKLNEEIQDTLINLMGEVEDLEQEIKEKKDAFVQFNSQVESEKEDIVKQAADEALEKKKLEKESEEISKKLDPKIKATYYNILEKAGGIAIVPVTNQVCTGCFLRIPPQAQIEIKKGVELILCPRCHRIVYLEEDRPI